jgi:hypothetical protein
MAKLDKIIPSITPTEAPNIGRPSKERAAEKLKEVMERDCKMVEGTFELIEAPGGSMFFNNTKYKGVTFPITMVDGHNYKIPKWLADYINGKDDSKDAFNPNSDKTINSCAVGISHFSVNKDELPKVNMDSVPAIGQKFKRRMRFIPLSFVEA